MKVCLQLIYFILFTTVLCAQKNVATISGEINNPVFYDVQFEYLENPVSENTISTKSLLGNNNDFSQTVEIDQATEVYISYNNQKRRIYIEPGDDLKLKFNGRDIIYSMTFSGKGAANNSFLHQFDLKFREWDNNDVLFYIGTLNPNSFKEKLDKVRDDKWAYLRNYPGKSAFSKDFLQFAYAEIDYWWAYNLLIYDRQKTSIQSDYIPMKGNSDYFSFLDYIDVDNDNAAHNLHYQRFIDAYIKYRKAFGKQSRKKYSYNVTEKFLNVYSEPGQGKITRLAAGNEVQYLSERSPKKATVKIGGKSKSDYWHKVKTASGLIGWMFRGGLSPVKKGDFGKIYQLGRKSLYNNASKHLTGNALELYLGQTMNKMYTKDGGSTLDKKDLTTYIDNAKNQSYKRGVSNLHTKSFSQQYGGFKENDNTIVLQNQIPKEDAIKQPSPAPVIKPRVTSPKPSLKPAPKKEKKIVQAISKPYKKGVTKLTGTVNNPKGRTITLRILRDFISKEVDELQVNLKEDNTFKVAFEINQGVLLTMQYANQEKTLYLEPSSDLNIIFDGNKSLWTMAYEGKGAAQNRFLQEYNNSFDKYSVSYIKYELAYRDPSNYRIFLNQIFRAKWDFYKKYDAKEKAQFSPLFNQYVTAEIDYWWAYSLLRYRWEHPAANEQPAPAKLDDSYYNFLKIVKANNQLALNNQYYHYFIGLYFKLYQEDLSVPLQELIKESTFVVASDELKILASPSKEPVLKTVVKGTTLKYLNEGSKFKSTRYIAGKNTTDQWYKVRTSDNVIGWVFGGGGQFKSAHQQLRSAKNIEKKVLTDVATVRLDKQIVRRSPGIPTAISIANKKDELVYLGEKSPQKYTFNIQGRFKNDHFLKVQTKDGQIGWIFGGAVYITKQLVTQKVAARNTDSFESIATDIFTDKVKYFALSQVIFDKIYLAEDPLEVTKEMYDFKRLNPYDEYDLVVQEAYNNRLDISPTSSSPRIKTIDLEPALAIKTKPKAAKETTGIKPKIIRKKVETVRAPIPKPRPSIKKATEIKVVQNPVAKAKDLAASNLKESPSPETKIKRTAPKSNPVPSMPGETPNSSLDERSKESNIDSATLAWLDGIGKATKTSPPPSNNPTIPKRASTQKTSKPDYLKIDTNPEKRPQFETKFSGRVTNPQIRDAKIVLYKNPVTFDEQIYNLYIRADGTFFTTLKLSDARNGKLIYGSQEMDIFIEPGDNINVEFQSIAMSRSIAFNGEGNNKNRYLRDYNKEFKFKDKGVSKHIEEDNLAKFQKYLKKLYSSKISFYKKFKKKHELSPTFAKYAKAEIDYWYYYQLINYPWEHPIYQSMSSPMAMPADYYDFLEEVELSPEGALPSQHYTYFLNVFFDNKEREQENIGYTRMELAQKYLKGEPLQYFKAKELARYCQRNQASKVSFEILQFLETCEYPLYRDAIKMVYAETRGLMKGMKAPNFDLVDDRGKAVQLSDFKGKVVYIDFWATWCTLCLNDFPNAKRLKQTFANQDVVFLYISLDENKKTWENYTRNHDIGGVQLFAEGSTRSEVAKSYGAKTLPLCILVDKDGNIGFAPAKRPSSPRAKQQINDLLQTPMATKQ